MLDHLRHVDGTPKVLNELESTVVGAVRHIYEVADRVARELERLQEENKQLRKICRQHGLTLPRAKR